MKMKLSGHFTISVIDSWDACLDENNKLGTILSSDTICAGSPVIIMLRKVSKQVQRKIRNFKFNLESKKYTYT